MDTAFLLEHQHEEQMLKDEGNRFVILPIDKNYEDIWKLYKDHESAFWKAEEIDYTADMKDWEKMSSNEKYFIEHILAFFAGSDGIVIENLLCKFGQEVKISEVRAFYGFQTMIENVHSLTYSNLIETFIKDEKYKKKLFNAINEMPAVKRKADWALSWITDTQPFAVRLVAFAVVEGIFFSGAFCSIFWLKDSNKMVKALGHSNELISRDESIHTLCAIKLFHKLKYKPNLSIIHNLIIDAVNIEKEFICDAIPCDMIGMNKKLMSEYIEYIADRLLQQLGYIILFGTSNPFSFMENLSLDGKTNFFEKRVSEYIVGSHSGVTNESFNTSSDDF